MGEREQIAGAMLQNETMSRDVSGPVQRQPELMAGVSMMSIQPVVFLRARVFL